MAPGFWARVSQEEDTPRREVVTRQFRLDRTPDNFPITSPTISPRGIYIGKQRITSVGPLTTSVGQDHLTNSPPLPDNFPGAHNFPVRWGKEGTVFDSPPGVTRPPPNTREGPRTSLLLLIVEEALRKFPIFPSTVEI